MDYKIELVSSPNKKRVVHHDSLKPFEGTGRFTDDEVLSDHDRPILSPTDKEDDAPNKALDDMADLFMPQSALMSDVPDAYRDTAPCDSSTDSEDDGSPPLPQRRRLRPRNRLKPPARFTPARTVTLFCEL